MIHLSKGNHKLDKGIINFSLPPIITRPGANQCKNYCYAMKSWKQYPGVRYAWTENLEETKKDDFIINMCKEIKRIRKLTAFRLHTSGDFYSQFYFEKWCCICNTFPKYIFYAYTKNFKLDLKNKPDNLILIASDDNNLFTDQELIQKGFNGRAVTIDKTNSKNIQGFTCPYPQISCGDSSINKCDYCFNRNIPFKNVLFKMH